MSRTPSAAPFGSQNLPNKGRGVTIYVFLKSFPHLPKFNGQLDKWDFPNEMAIKNGLPPRPNDSDPVGLDNLCLLFEYASESNFVLVVTKDSSLWDENEVLSNSLLAVDRILDRQPERALVYCIFCLFKLDSPLLIEKINYAATKGVNFVENVSIHKHLDANFIKVGDINRAKHSIGIDMIYAPLERDRKYPQLTLTKYSPAVYAVLVSAIYLSMGVAPRDLKSALINSASIWTKNGADYPFLYAYPVVSRLADHYSFFGFEIQNSITLNILKTAYYHNLTNDIECIRETRTISSEQEIEQCKINIVLNAKAFNYMLRNKNIK